MRKSVQTLPGMPLGSSPMSGPFDLLLWWRPPSHNWPHGSLHRWLLTVELQVNWKDPDPQNPIQSTHEDEWKCPCSLGNMSTIQLSLTSHVMKTPELCSRRYCGAWRSVVRLVSASCWIWVKKKKKVIVALKGEEELGRQRWQEDKSYLLSLGRRQCKEVEKGKRGKRAEVEKRGGEKMSREREEKRGENEERRREEERRGEKRGEEC